MPSPNAPTISAPLGETEIATDELLLLLPPLLPFGLLERSSNCGSAAAARAVSAWRNSAMVFGTAGPASGAGVARARVAQKSVVWAMNFIVVSW